MLAAVFPFISQSIPSSPKYAHMQITLTHTYKSAHKHLHTINSSIIFPEQYIIHPLFMFQFYTLKPLFYFCVVVVLDVIDGVLYIKTCIKSNTM